MTTYHQQLVDAAKARMALIKKADGYFTDAGNHVDEHREAALLPGAIGAGFEHLNVRDLPETYDSEGTAGPLGCWNRELTIGITATATSGKTDDAMTHLGKLVADVIKAVGVDDTWGGIALLTAVDPGKPEGEQDEKKVASQTVLLKIQYRTAPWSSNSTAIVEHRTTDGTIAADVASGLLKQLATQIGSVLAAGRTLTWRLLGLRPGQLPVIDVRRGDNPPVSEDVTDGPDKETKLLPATITIMYKDKDSLGTLRIEKEAIFAAIGTDPSLGGLALDCLPRQSEWEMSNDESMIIGIKISMDILYSTDKWIN